MHLTHGQPCPLHAWTPLALPPPCHSQALFPVTEPGGGVSCGFQCFRLWPTPLLLPGWAQLIPVVLIALLTNIQRAVLATLDHNADSLLRVHHSATTSTYFLPTHGQTADTEGIVSILFLPHLKGYTSHTPGIWLALTFAKQMNLRFED